MKRPALKDFRRIVIKVGSSLLVDSAGDVKASWLAALAADIAKLHGEGATCSWSRPARSRSGAAA